MLQPQLIKLEDIRITLPCDDELRDEILEEGFYPEIPVLRPKDAEDNGSYVYKCVLNNRVVASWPFEFITVFILTT